jgi:oligoendopeptidase F
MFDNFPTDPTLAFDWAWEDYQPFFDDLMARDLNHTTLAAWMADFSRLNALIEEVEVQLYFAKAAHTNDKQAKKRFFAFLDVYEKLGASNNQLQQKLLASGLSPQGFEIPLRQMQADVTLFREENLPLLTQLQKLGNQYDEISGAQTIELDGETLTITQAGAKLQDRDRDLRQKVWELAYRRRQEDTEALNELWVKMLDIRVQVAANAGMADYREYAWQASHRFDYTPADNLRFHAAIQEVAVPAMLRMLDRRRVMLGQETLRPWDMLVDPTNQPPLQPFQTADELIAGGRRIFSELHPDLMQHYAAMQDNNLLDLDNRPNKAPGGFCAPLPISQQSLIFMNAVGIHDNVQTLLHEAGHAFHNYESYHLPYHHQRDYPMEFAEVASMAMELLAAPHLQADRGGFYSEANAARARIEHLETSLYFWCYMAVVDGFQHWVYTHPSEAKDPANCNATWAQLWDTFLPGVDWSGYEDIKATGWQRKLHIYHIPFYYLEYGLAQLGAGQVWRNSLADYDQALKDYRHALALGNTRKLPELYEAAGAKLAFDAETLGEVVGLIETTINDLDATLKATS